MSEHVGRPEGSASERNLAVPLPAVDLSSGEQIETAAMAEVLSDTDEELPPPPEPAAQAAREFAAAMLQQCVATDEQAGAPTIPGYEILGKLGRGGMGVVYQARQLGLNRVVAIKMVLAGTHAESSELTRFRTETEAVARLQHANIVQVFEAGEQQGCPYFTMEFMDGGSLAQRLAGKPQPARLAAQVIETLARAVHFAHQHGIVHRDLKPANVLLARTDRTDAIELGTSGDDESVRYEPKITDFGLAKQLPALTSRQEEWCGSGQTRTGEMLGTPSYMAPEQAEGKAREIGPAADIYAMGAILYEMLTGRPPFLGVTPLETLRQLQSDEPVPPRRLQPKLPRDLETICLKCLEKEPRRRYADAGRLADDLRRFLAGEPIEARPIPFWERGYKWARRRPARAGLFAVSTAAAVLLAVGGWWSYAELSTLASDLFLQARRADHNAQLAEEGRSKAERLSASLAFDTGLMHCEQHDVSRGLVWLGRSLELAVQGDAADLEWAIRMNLAAWQPRLRPLRANLQHQGSVLAVAVSPDGALALTGTDGNSAQLWELDTAERRGPRLKHDGEVRSVAYSRDGRMVLTGSNDKFARLWDLATYEPIAEFQHTDFVNAVALSPDSRIVATASLHCVQLWDARTGTPGTVLEHRDHVHALAFSPDGRLVVTGSSDRTAQLWEVATGKPLGVLQHEAPVRAVAFSPTEDRVVTGGDDYTTRLWETTTGAPIGLPLRHQARVRAVAYSPDGQTILAGYVDGTAQLWDAATGNRSGPSVHHQDIVWSVAFVPPDGRTIITASADRTVRLWDAPVEQPDSWALLEHADKVQVVKASPDGKTLLTGSADQTAQLWVAATAERIGDPLEHQGPVTAAAFSPDSRTVVTGSDDSFVRLWDATTGEPLPSPPRQEKWVKAVAFSPDGRSILVGSGDGTVTLWDITTRETKLTMRDGTGIQAVAFSPDGRIIVTGDKDGTARLYDAVTGQLVCPPLAHPGNEAVIAVAFSPDGQTVLTGSWDNTARLWDAATGAPRARPLRHQARLSVVAFAPDGKTVLTASWDHTARVWDATTGEPIGPPLLHQGPVWAAAYRADSRIVLTGSDDQTARLWDAVSGRPLGAPLAHRSLVRAVAFSPDGHRVITGSWDGTARVWNVPTAAPGEVERIVLQTKVLTGMELDHTVARGLDAETWENLRRRLAELD